MHEVAASNYRYTNGPLVGLLAVLTMLLLARFVFGTGRRKPAPPRDFGLLIPVASLPTRAAAETALDLLMRHGIRATLADRPSDREPIRITADGRELPRPPPGTVTDLLVFPADADAARRLLTP